MAANKSSRNGDVMVTSQVGQRGQTGVSGWSKQWCKLGVRAQGMGALGDVRKLTPQWADVGRDLPNGLTSGGEAFSMGRRHEGGMLGPGMTS